MTTSSSARVNWRRKPRGKRRRNGPCPRPLPAVIAKAHSFLNGPEAIPRRLGTHDVRNGLLLRADFHRLFDAGLVSVNRGLGPWDEKP